MRHSEKSSQHGASADAVALRALAGRRRCFGAQIVENYDASPMPLRKDLNTVLLIGGFCTAAVPLMPWITHRPLQATTTEQLIERGFQLQNRSEVAFLVKNKVGWQALHTTLIQSGASVADADSIIRVSKARMAGPSNSRKATAPLWPVFVKPAHLGSQKVWLVEGAAPGKPKFFDCGTGVGAWQRYKVCKRNKGICAHRVLIVQSRPPYAVLGAKDVWR